MTGFKHAEPLPSKFSSSQVDIHDMVCFAIILHSITRSEQRLKRVGGVCCGRGIWSNVFISEWNKCVSFFLRNFSNSRVLLSVTLFSVSKIIFHLDYKLPFLALRETTRLAHHVLGKTLKSNLNKLADISFRKEKWYMPVKWCESLSH